MPDLNNAGPQFSTDLIAEGTIVQVQITVRPGGAGEGGWLKRSKAGDSMAIDAEFTVTEGPHAKRKFWKLYTVEGTTEGHAKAAEISAGQLRAMLESVHGIKPDDESENAKQKRRIATWGDFDGLRFIAKVGIEKGTEGYKDKNTLAEVITPDKKAWASVPQIPRQNSPQAAVQAAQPAMAAQAGAGAQAAAQAPQRPSWAQ